MKQGRIRAHMYYMLADAVSRKSRSAVKKNRIIKLYFEIDMIGQLYSHVTLTM